MQTTKHTPNPLSEQDIATLLLALDLEIKHRKMEEERVPYEMNIHISSFEKWKERLRKKELPLQSRERYPLLNCLQRHLMLPAQRNPENESSHHEYYRKLFQKIISL